MAESNNQTLQGRRVVITRQRDQAIEWRKKLETLGAAVIELPLIQVRKDVNLNTLAEVLAEFGSYEWIIFTSTNGVKYFFEEFIRVHEDIRALGLVRIAAVGEATASAIRDLHLRVDLQPKKSQRRRVGAGVDRAGIDGQRQSPRDYRQFKSGRHRRKAE